MNRIILAALALVAACAPTAETAPLTGARIGGDFHLVDQNGRLQTATSLGDVYRIMYFGYTSCPDVCPTDMARLSQGLKVLRTTDASAAARVRIVFVSVDPQRDTPPVLKAFASNFDAQVIALTGAPDAIAKAARAYGVAFSVGPGQDKANYLVDHSRVAYLMSPANLPIALVPQDGTPEAIAAVLTKWVR